MGMPMPPGMGPGQGGRRTGRGRLDRIAVARHRNPDGGTGAAGAGVQNDKIRVAPLAARAIVSYSALLLSSVKTDKSALGAHHSAGAETGTGKLLATGWKGPAQCSALHTNPSARSSAPLAPRSTAAPRFYTYECASLGSDAEQDVAAAAAAAATGALGRVAQQQVAGCRVPAARNIEEQAPSCIVSCIVRMGMRTSLPEQRGNQKIGWWI
ncbi:unnamed protein product [Miscanthus lutarioriparius]|uniref:Uncharacterized protein n=1 Tax=Miscanthus lutarioriparius TaxID=422564 RepID=A0A811SS84_9POAL|nr:unnamed protein product [Miscanthus lutarioriparius]